jgi:tRNA (Thr-GGU) A37 N-methylase
VSNPIVLRPIGSVQSARSEPTDDAWDSVEAVVLLDAEQFGTDATTGLDGFSHVEIRLRPRPGRR